MDHRRTTSNREADSPPASRGRDSTDGETKASRAEDSTARPALTPQLSGAELRRWYWLRSELANLARQMDVSTAGGKQLLTDRLAAALDGLALPVAAPRRPAPAGQLSGVLSLDTVIPVGQRCSQALRAFFTQHLGAAFAFDAAMRTFIADHAGSTLGDAIDHWHTSRSAGPRPIDAQFELNRFTRRWYEEHPGGTRPQLQQAWAAYRTTPADRRPRA